MEIIKNYKIILRSLILMKSKIPKAAPSEIKIRAGIQRVLPYNAMLASKNKEGHHMRKTLFSPKII